MQAYVPSAEEMIGHDIDAGSLHYLSGRLELHVWTFRTLACNYRSFIAL